MEQTMVNLRMDKEIISGMEKACDNMGLSIAAAFNIFAAKVAKEQKMPFQPTIEERLLAVIKAKNIPEITLECDENGYAIIDKEKHPRLYDWAVNG